MSTRQALVLVVDGDPAFGGMISEILTEKGFGTAVFADPKAALDAATDGRFAAAVVNL